MEIDYDQIEREESPFAERLAHWIHHVINPRDVLDIGCGPGMYVRELNKLGTKATGIDSDPRVLNVPDLSYISLFENEQSAELVLCMEVAEHLPVESAHELVERVADATEGYLIWTAAQPGQGGVGHINCQPVHVWEDLFWANGFCRNHLLENALKYYARSGYHMGWFVNNLMILEP